MIYLNDITVKYNIINENTNSIKKTKKKNSHYSTKLVHIKVMLKGYTLESYRSFEEIVIPNNVVMF